MTKKEEKVQLEGVTIPDWYLQLEAEIIEVLALEAQVKSRKEKLQTTLLTMMENGNIDSIKSDLTSSTRKVAYDSVRFDTTRFKAENPTEYKAYCKNVSIAPSVVLKWLKQPNGAAK